jgi:hypothetical protein
MQAVNLSLKGNVIKMVDKIIKKCELQTQLAQTNDTKEKNKIKEEIRKINPQLFKELVGYDVEITPDILQEIQQYIDKRIDAMWQVFYEYNNNVMVLLYIIFQKTPLKDIIIDESEIPEYETWCPVAELSEDGKMKRRQAGMHSLDNRKFVTMGMKNLLLQSLINSIHRRINPWEIERHIKLFAKILVKRKIIDANRERTFYIIFSFGFSQNYIVTSYMIPACVEYLFVKILKANGVTAESWNPEHQDVGDAHNLNNLLGNPQNVVKLKQYIDANIIDKFHFLFKERNLRNDIYHGTIADELHGNGYLWYLFCRFVMQISLNKS